MSQASQAADSREPSVPMMMRQTPAGSLPLGHRTNIQWLCPKSKTARLLQQLALKRSSASGRPPYQRRLLRRLNFWTVPVAAHSRRKTSCASLRRSTRGGRPRSGRRDRAPRGALLVGAVGLAASARRGRLRRAKPAKRGPKTAEPNPLAELALSRRENLRLKQRLARAETIIELQKKPSRNAAACGIETVVRYPGCGRERPSTFWWRVTP